MSRKTAIVLLEGQNELKFLNDWKIKRYGMTQRWDEKKVIHANQIDYAIIAYIEKYDTVYFIVDNDDNATNKKIYKAKEMASTVEGFQLKVFVQDPEFESFCASCFTDFRIDDRDSQEEIKTKARAFLKTKNNNIKQKEWTYTDILAKGGNLENAKRYEKRFGIIKFLDR